MMMAIRKRLAPVLGTVAMTLTLLALLGVHWGVTVLALCVLTASAAVHPPSMVAAVVLTIPVQSEIMLPFVRGDLTLTQLVLFGLIAGWGVVFWRRRIWLDSIVVGFLLVLAAYAVSFIAVENPGLWLQESYRWAVAGVFYVICRSVIHEWRDIRPIIWAILAGVLGVSLMSGWQLVFDPVLQSLPVGRAVRVYATFGTPNTLAAYLEMTIPLLLACIPVAWFIKGEFQFSLLEKLLLVGVPAIGAMTLLLSQSRGGLVGMLVACVVLWLLLPAKSRIITGMAGMILIGGLLFTGLGQSQLSRFELLREETSGETHEENRSTYDVGTGRGALWSTAQIMIAEKPFTGFGAGQFDEYYREYVPSWIDRLPSGQAHNVWLQMGAQAGIGGILGYTVWFTASVWSVITARRRTADRHRYWLMSGVLAVFAAYSVHSMVDYLNVLSLGLQLSVLTAIALNLAPVPLTRYKRSIPSLGDAAVPEVSPCPQ